MHFISHDTKLYLTNQKDDLTHEKYSVVITQNNTRVTLQTTFNKHREHQTY